LNSEDQQNDQYHQNEQSRFIYLFLVFNATFSNISAISWRPVLVMEEEYSERMTDYGQAIGKLHHLRLRVECTLFCILQSQA
jgi:predicted secreted protein